MKTDCDKVRNVNVGRKLISSDVLTHQLSGQVNVENVVNVGYVPVQSECSSYSETMSNQVMGNESCTSVSNRIY